MVSYEAKVSEGSEEKSAYRIIRRIRVRRRPSAEISVRVHAALHKPAHGPRRRIRVCTC